VFYEIKRRYEWMNEWIGRSVGRSMIDRSIDRSINQSIKQWQVMGNFNGNWRQINSKSFIGSYVLNPNTRLKRSMLQQLARCLMLLQIKKKLYISNWRQNIIATKQVVLTKKQKLNFIMLFVLTIVQNSDYFPRWSLLSHRCLYIQ